MREIVTIAGKKFVKKGDLKTFCEWTQRPYGKGKILLLMFGLGHENVKCGSAGNFCLWSASVAMLVLFKLCFQFPDSRALTEIKTHVMLSFKTRTYAHNYKKTKKISVNVQWYWTQALKKKRNRHVYAVNSSQGNFSLEVDVDLNKNNFEAGDKVEYYFP